MDRPVIDMTELKGNYDIRLEFTPEDYTAMLIRAGIAAGVAMPPQALKALEFSSGDSLRERAPDGRAQDGLAQGPLPVLVLDQWRRRRRRTSRGF